MRKRKARQRKRLVLFGAVVLAVALVTTLALSLNAKSPEPEPESTLTAPTVSSIPLMNASAPIYSASMQPNTGDVVLLESPVPSEPEPESLGEFVLTAYCPCVKCCGEWSAEHPSRVGTDYIQKTASGTIPAAGRTISVDTSVIPFGTTVIIRGREYVAEDRGGAIKGNRIDIFFDDHDEALEFGRQTAEVFIINNKED